jgi:hypothetical protein
MAALGLAEYKRTDDKEMFMRYLIIAVFLLTGVDASAKRTCDKDECHKVKTAIRAIEARMRNGYTAAQGIRFDERLRKLKDKRSDVCC